MALTTNDLIQDRIERFFTIAR